MVTSTRIALRRYAPYLLLAVLTMLVLGRGLLPGYLFLLDMPWPEQFTISAYTQNGLPPHAPILVLLQLLGLVFPGWLLQKLILFAILFGAATGTYQLARWVHKNTPLRGLSGRGNPAFIATASGVLALLNPYVLERLLAGQWLVVAGFAYTPFVMLALLKLLAAPSARRALLFGVLYALFPMISLHWCYIVTPLLLLVTGLHQLYSPRRLPGIQLAAGLLGTALTLLISNVFWLSSIAGSNGRLSSIGIQDFNIFQTVDRTGYGLELGVLSQHGFWRGLTVLPTPSLAQVASGLALFAVAVAGVVFLARRRSILALAFAAGTPFVIILALGYGHPLGQSAIQASLHVPGFAGLRETAKLIGLITLFVALYAPIGASYLLRKRLAARATAVVIIIISSAIYLPTVARSSQLKSYHYPASYAEAREILQEINQPTLVLPWSRYLKLDFAGNQFVANPASVYFNSPVRLSDASGNRLLDADLNQFEQSLRRPYSADWVSTAQSAGYSYILLQKTDAWQNHQVLLQDHTVIYDSAEIAIVRVD